MTDSTEHLARRCRAAWSVEYGMKVVPPWEGDVSRVEVRPTPELRAVAAVFYNMGRNATQVMEEGR